MTAFEHLPHEEQLRRLACLAHAAIARYPLPAGATPRLANYRRTPPIASMRATGAMRQGSIARAIMPGRPSPPSSPGSSPCVPTGRQ